jgi:hypothetical protein
VFILTSVIPYAETIGSELCVAIGIGPGSDYGCGGRLLPHFFLCLVSRELGPSCYLGQ